MLLTWPQLSEDIYRFIWDGRLWHTAIHPLDATPQDLMETSLSVEWESLFENLNSKTYHTIYPPLAQLMFYAAGLFSEIYHSILFIKLCIFLGDIGILVYGMRLLDVMSLDRKNILIYFLNPLVIIEGMGNAHFESIYVALCLMAVYYLKRGNFFSSSFLYAQAILVKLLPLMFAPILLVYISKLRRRIIYLLISGLIVLLAFVLFFVDADLVHFFESVDLYFQKFEFNASIYFVVRAIGQWLTGYNQIWIIGPLLSIAGVALMIRYLLKASKPLKIGDVLDLMYLFFIIYLLLATTVHPWYLILPLAFSVFKPRLYIIVWSFTVVFSYYLYQSYDYPGYHLFVACEYILVGLAYYLEKKGKLRMGY